jgi:hypothetical protein
MEGEVAAQKKTSETERRCSLVGCGIEANDAQTTGSFDSDWISGYTFIFSIPGPVTPSRFSFLGRLCELLQMDQCLRCNSLRCRQALTTQAVVTNCSHIFCVDWSLVR